LLSRHNLIHVTRKPAASQTVLDIHLANPADGFNFGELDVRGELFEVVAEAIVETRTRIAGIVAAGERRVDAAANREAAVRRGTFRRVK
jgi:hypothetical protein